MKCAGCGKDNASDAKVCVWCGKDVAAAKPTLPISPAIGAWQILGYTVACLIVLALFDAPSIKNDYTVADLRSAAPQYNNSFDVLAGLAEQEEYPEGAPAIGLSAADVNAVEGFADVFQRGDIARAAEAIKADSARIDAAWADGAKGRAIIDKLAEYPEIADLSEPVSISEPDKDVLYTCLGSMKELSYLYRAHVCLEVERGNDLAAAEELVKFDGVFRKLNVNARNLVTKLVCTGIMSGNMATAGYVANRPQTSSETLRLLVEHFQPLDKSQTALRNALVFEYLRFGKTLDWIHSKTYNKWVPGWGNRRNSTLRFYRNFTDRWIAQSEGTPVAAVPKFNVWPAIGPRWVDVQLDAKGKLPKLYTIYNPVGGMLVAIMAPAWERIPEVVRAMQVRDDMLRAVLDKRLGREVSLKARAYGDEYIIDIPGKRIVSPGPDGELNTKDDIKMPIDPNVVRFGEMVGDQ